MLSNSENLNLYLENNFTNPPEDMNLQSSVPPLQPDSLFSVKNQKKKSPGLKAFNTLVTQGEVLLSLGIFFPLLLS